VTISRVLLVSGMPGVGKTHLAQRLAARYGLPIVAKDLIKESLFDSLGQGDPRWSQQLSKASFTVMFAVAARILDARGSVLLEGNFRVGEHEPALKQLLHGRQSQLIQVLCRLPENVRRARLEQRAARNERHPGHLDQLFLRRLAERIDSADQFLDLPSIRCMHEVHSDAEQTWDQLVRELDTLCNTAC
jgi:predicted kinase